MTYESLTALPEGYNAASDLLNRNLVDGQRDKVALIDVQGAITYGELAERARGFGRFLRDMGIEREQRIILCLTDTRAFHVAFLGAIWVGIIPVPVNTLLTSSDCEWLLQNSRARAVFVSPQLRGKWAEITRVTQGTYFQDLCPLSLPVADSGLDDCAPTHRDEPAFWLYSSGSTGRPKGVMHTHASLRLTADLYGVGVAGYRNSDVVLSVAKLFFAYGLGNSLTFPMSVGATVILSEERAKPEAVADLVENHAVTVLNGVPTFFAALLASSTEGYATALRSLRLVTSAGETLPSQVGAEFKRRYGSDILDGLGSTEMLHIFLSQTPGEVRYGFTGRPVPGYSCAIKNEDGSPTTAGEVGNLVVSGPTSATGYWNNRPGSLNTFNGKWTNTGDKYSRTEDGWFRFHGRSDDMLKVGGIFVSPLEIEECLIGHAAVREVAVVGTKDESGLTKPLAYVVLNGGWNETPDLVDTLKAHAKAHLAPYKFPHQIKFLDELPKTSTGKIQRYRLRT